jgi:hypothetical protein
LAGRYPTCMRYYKLDDVTSFFYTSVFQITSSIPNQLHFLYRTCYKGKIIQRYMRQEVGYYNNSTNAWMHPHATRTPDKRS